MQAGSADFFSSLLAAADTYLDAAAAARAATATGAPAATGVRARAAPERIDGELKLAARLPKMVEQVVVKGGGLSKLIAAATTHRKNLRLTQARLTPLRHGCCSAMQGSMLRGRWSATRHS